MVKNPSVSPTIELLEAASSCFANAENPYSTGIYPEMTNDKKNTPGDKIHANAI